MAVEFFAGDLKDYLVEILKRHRTRDADAQLTADMYIGAELSGHGSHGLMRFLRIIRGIRSGTHCPANRPRVVRKGASTALMDGNRALGVPVAASAMRLAADLAARTGVGCVGVRNSNHFGRAGFYSALAARRGLIGLALCNTQPAIAPPGGEGPVLGTNPLAIAAPTRGEPLVLDMSAASLPRGRILEAARKGEAIPSGAALDEKGNPTTDPERALAGALLPFGGAAAYKTFGLALMIDILCGPLTGAAFGTRVTGTAETTEPCTKGDFFAALDVSRFRDSNEFLDDVETLASMVRRSGTAVLLPGEIETRRMQSNEGRVRLDDDLAEALMETGRAVGVTDCRPAGARET